MSNHPPTITKNIPLAVNKRLSSLSSNEQVFNSVIKPYQEALKNSGYDHKLKFDKNSEENSGKKKSRSRRILWFNPPFSQSVATKIGARFLKLIDEHFPKDNPLSKILNRNTVKVSYRTTPNMAKIISGHNSKLTTKPEAPLEKSCNCNNEDTCPIGGDCLKRNVIYQATVTSDQAQTEPETYVGLTAQTFKKRFDGHANSFRHEKYSKETKLSIHIWKLKRQDTNYNLTWKVVSRARPFSPTTGLCALCTEEKYFILYKSELASLNKRNEIKTHCRHKQMVLLVKT